MNNSSRLLLHPLFLFSLVILILNDHVLKAAYPSLVTGKLSDFAGLIVFAFFFAVVGGKYFNPRRSLIILHLAIGVAFTLFKIAPIDILWEKIAALTTFPLPGRTKDATDLIALTVLPLSYWIIIRSKHTLIEADWGRLMPWGKMALLSISGLAIIATTPAFRPPCNVTEHIEFSHFTPAEILFRIESLLIENGFESRGLTSGQHETATSHVIAFTFDDKRTITVDGQSAEYSFDFYGAVYLTGDSNDRLVFDSVATRITKPRDNMAAIEALLREQIIEPMRGLRGVK